MKPETQSIAAPPGRVRAAKQPPRGTRAEPARDYWTDDRPDGATQPRSTWRAIAARVRRLFGREATAGVGGRTREDNDWLGIG